MTLGSVMLGCASSGAALWTSRLPNSETICESNVHASTQQKSVFIHNEHNTTAHMRHVG